MQEGWGDLNVGRPGTHCLCIFLDCLDVTSICKGQLVAL